MQLDLSKYWKENAACLPLAETARRANDDLHVTALGAKLTDFTQEDADYTVVMLERLSRSTRSSSTSR